MSTNANRETGVGELSAPLRVIVEQLAQDAQSLADRLFDALGTGIRDYGQLDNGDTAQDVRRSVRRNVDIWYASLLSGEPPDSQSLAALSEFGRHRVHQGLSLNSVLQAYRVGSRVIWEELLRAAGDERDLQRELLLKVSPYILYHFDILGQTIGLAYNREEQNLARWRDRLRHDLCSVIFSSPADSVAFREQVLTLGLDDSAPHVALALQLESSDVEPRGFDQNSDALVAELCAAMALGKNDFLHYRRHDHWLAWLPLATGESAIDGERRIAEAAGALEKAIEQSPVGIGLPNTGPQGWRRSADQAIRAIDLGARLKPRRALFRYVDVCLDDAVLGDEATAQFLQGLVERLALEPHLLETLEAYFDRRGYRKLIAADLAIHPNTLSYRLDRIQSTLDIELDDPNWQAALHTALRLRQLGPHNRP